MPSWREGYNEKIDINVDMEDDDDDIFKNLFIDDPEIIS